MNVSDQEIKKILERYKKILIYGLSSDASKPSQRIPLFMKSKKYDVVGLHPQEKNIAGISIYQTLKEVPEDYRKFIDVFRKPESIPQIVDDILAIGGTDVLWLQLGITHPEAEKKAEAAGLKVVSNRCLMIEYNKWLA